MSSHSAFIICITLILLQQISATNLPQLIKKQPNLPHHQTQAQQYHHHHAQQQQHANVQQTQKQTTVQHQQQQQQVQTVQYVHDNEEQQQQQQQEQQESIGDTEILKNSHVNDDELNNDPYQILSDLKPESRLPSSINYPWNPYSMYNHNPPFPYGTNYPNNPYEQPPSLPSQPQPPPMPMPMPKFLPFVGYAQPVFIPFPLYIAPDMFYPGHETSNDIEDLAMSRAAQGRRPGVPTSYQRPNSPIYYVRLPPTPYMFVPNPIGPTGPFGNGFSPLLTYQPMPTFSSFGSVFNLPVNFLANGKPSNIYQMGAAASNELPAPPPPPPSSSFSGYQGFNARPPTPSNPYRPQSSYNMPPHAQGFGLTSAMPPPQHDSKMTSLKRPFVFNGRPEDIFILPNNFNPLYPENSYY